MHWTERENVVAYGDAHRRCEVCNMGITRELHHKFPKSREDEYPGDDVHEDANLCAVCGVCHEAWDSIVGKKPSPMACKALYHAKNLARLYERYPGKKWRLMAPQFILEAYERTV